ncbi:MAG: hypothetical protein ACLGH8_01220 [Bacteroidia bacterium]
MTIQKKNNYNFSEFDEFTTVDTVNHKIYFATDFHYSKDDLQQKPFIKDDEILNLNLKTNTIEFTNLASEKIFKLKPHMGNGVQFVISVDKKPVMNGYFYNPYSSNGSTWNTIQYDDFKKIKDTTSKLSSYYFSIFRGDGTSNRLGRIKIDFNNYPILLKALKDSHRLVE